MNYDTLLQEEVGGFGRWQAMVVASLWAGSFYSGMAVLVYPLVFATPGEFRCAVPGCDGGHSSALEEVWVGGAIPRSGEV